MNGEEKVPSLLKASVRGVEVNRANAQAFAEQMMRIIGNLQACGIVTNKALARELHRLGYRGRRGGRIDRKRIVEMRERLGLSQQMRKL